jgi:hypothetical protein
MPMPWNPFHPAVFVAPHPHAVRISLVRHDGYPYEEDWNEGATGWSGLFDIANRYVALVNSRLKLPSQWLDTLQEQPPTGPPLTVWLHWLRDQDARHSYWVMRQAGLDAPSRPRNGPVRDRAAVLLAGLYQELKKRPLYGGQGLRIIVQTGSTAPGPYSIPRKSSSRSATFWPAASQARFSSSTPAAPHAARPYQPLRRGQRLLPHEAVLRSGHSGMPPTPPRHSRAAREQAGQVRWVTGRGCSKRVGLPTGIKATSLRDGVPRARRSAA